MPKCMEENGNGGRVRWQISDDCSEKNFGKRRQQSSLDNNLHCETYLVVTVRAAAALVG